MGKVSWKESTANRNLECVDNQYFKGGGRLPEKPTSERGKRRAAKKGR